MSHALEHEIVRFVVILKARVDRGGGRRISHVHDHLRLLVLEAGPSVAADMFDEATYPHFS